MNDGLPHDEATPDRVDQSSRFEHELVTTLFDLGRQVTSVLDLDDLLQQIPRLIRRLIPFEAYNLFYRGGREALLAELRAEIDESRHRRRQVVPIAVT